jgi:hypothetical protein
MKYAIIFLSFYFYQITSIFAQEKDSLIVETVENPVKLNVEKRNISGAEQEVFALWVIEANTNDVSKAWEKAMESGNKAKMTSDGNRHEIIGIILKEIDKENPMNVYSEIRQGHDGVHIYVAFQLSGSSWIDPNSNQDKTIKAENLLSAFGVKVYLELLDDKLSIEKGELKDIEKEYSANLKSQSNERKSIQADSLSIFNIINEIKIKKDEYSSSNDKLSKQRNYVASTNFSSDDDKKEANKLVKDIEKELKKIMKSIENMQSDIIDKERDINDYHSEIGQLKIHEDELMSRLTDQRILVEEIEHEIYDLEKNN